MLPVDAGCPSLDFTQLLHFSKFSTRDQVRALGRFLACSLTRFSTKLTQGKSAILRRQRAAITIVGLAEGQNAAIFWNLVELATRAEMRDLC